MRHALSYHNKACSLFPHTVPEVRLAPRGASLPLRLDLLCEDFMHARELRMSTRFRLNSAPVSQNLCCFSPFPGYGSLAKFRNCHSGAEQSKSHSFFALLSSFSPFAERVGQSDREQWQTRRRPRDFGNSHCSRGRKESILTTNFAHLHCCAECCGFLGRNREHLPNCALTCRFSRLRI